MSQSPIYKMTDDQRDFIDGISQSMAGIMEKASLSDVALDIPFSAASGREFSGANMTRLLLTSIEKGYSDNRWISFHNLQEFQKQNPDLKVHVRKGEKGTKILRPQEVAYVVEDGEKRILSEERQAELLSMREAGLDIPEVKRGMMFYAYTVFNAEQIEGFPAKEKTAPMLSSEEKTQLVEDFAGASGVHFKYISVGSSFYSHEQDVAYVAEPTRFASKEEYAASKLREAFHAFGNQARENRLPMQGSTLKPYAVEEIRGEFFSLMAGKYMGLPCETVTASNRIMSWGNKFVDGDARAIFKAATEAAKAVTLLHQFRNGEQPKASWFPKQENWKLAQQLDRKEQQLHEIRKVFRDAIPVLRSKMETYAVGNAAKDVISENEYQPDILRERLKEVQQALMSLPSMPKAQELLKKVDEIKNNPYLQEGEGANRPSAEATPTSMQGPTEEEPKSKPEPEPKALSASEQFAQKVHEFDAVDDPVLKVRMLLRDPQFLEMALKQDPECTRDLANLCDSMSSALHMELDARQQEQQRQDVQPASSRMRL